MASHWAEACPWTPDLPAQKGEIRYRLHIGDAVLVLRQAHRPANYHAFGAKGDFRRRVD